MLPPDASTNQRRKWLVVNVSAFLGLLYFVLYYLTGFRFITLFTLPGRQVDFALWRFIPSYIFEHSRYPAAVTGDWEHTIFQYLPSAAALMLPLSWPPNPVAFSIWLLIEAGCLVIVLWVGLGSSGALQLRARWLVALAAVLLSENSLGWDFRNHNNNIVYLAFVMLALQTRSIWLAGTLVALSINLKLYSGLIPVVLLWRGEYRLAAATGVMTVLIAVLLPAAVFGPDALPQLAADWYAQIHYSMEINGRGTASLVQSVASLLSADPGSRVVSTVLLSVQAAWLALVLGYYVIAAREPAKPGLPAAQARLADLGVALLAPLPLSFWFIPYHAVVMLPIYVLLVSIAMAASYPRWLRGAATAACLTCQIVRIAFPDWNVRGAIFLASFVILVLALGAVRRFLVAGE